MQSSIIVLDAEAVFKESDWIGVNKKYQDVPPEVSDTRNAVLQVPELQSKRLFPSYKLPVTKFLEFKLPKNMKSITGTKTKVWFSAGAPRTDTECLRTRPVPQEKVNNSGFQLSPVDMALFNDLKNGKEQLKKAMKAFRKREKTEDDA